MGSAWQPIAKINMIWTFINARKMRRQCRRQCNGSTKVESDKNDDDDDDIKVKRDINITLPWTRKYSEYAL